MSLISKCVCGSQNFQFFKKHRLNLASCKKCRVIHQTVKMNEQQYNDFYKNEYHGEYQNTLGLKEYKKRYDHDKHIASVRFEKYDFHIPARGRILDIGSSNGAFVDYARNDLKYDAYGVDFTDHEWTYKGPLDRVNFPTEYFDAITMHDVLEHLIDPVETLKEVRRVLKPGGKLIVDFPDYHKPEGLHHWRPIQHLWYFTKDQLIDILFEAGFNTTEVDHPIASKFVAYTYNMESIASETKILVLPGMGDIYWVLVKLEAFLEHKKIEMPKVYVWNLDQRPRSKEFLDRFPFLKSAGYWDHTPTNKEHKVLFNTYNTFGEWLVPDFGGFDYYISMNGMLTDGKSMDKELNQYESNWYPKMFESIKEINFGKAFKKKHGDYIVAFFSGLGMFEHWVNSMPIHTIYSMLKEIYLKTGTKLVLTGCYWDLDFSEQLIKMDEHNIFINMVDKTGINELYGIMKNSKGMIGWCGGNSIMSTVFKKPTIMFWCKAQFPKDFKLVCCPPESLNKWYHPFDVEDLDIEEVVELAVSQFGKSKNKNKGKDDVTSSTYSSRNRRRLLDPNEANF